MAAVKYQMDPKEAGVELGNPSQPTEKGWEVVTPRMWYFRNNQICDKVQIQEGYADPEWWIDFTKSYYMMQAWEENPQISASDLALAGLKRSLENQNIVIRPRELLVGHPGNDHHAIVSCFAETPWLTNEDLIYEGRTYIWDAEKKEKVHITPDSELFKRFETFARMKNHQHVIKNYIPEMIYRMAYGNFLRWWEPVGGIGARFNPEMRGWLFDLGHKGIMEEVKKTVARLEKELSDPDTKGPQAEELGKRLNEMKDCQQMLEVIIGWVKRHAEKARELRKTETDPSEQKRLDDIAECCDWIAENPPRNLRDALQLYTFWFEALGHLETVVHSISLRMDQEFWPFYKKDVLEDQTLSRTEAGELLAQQCFKMCEHGIAVSKHGVRLYGMGTRDYITVTLGGEVPETGADAWNELTNLIIDVIDGYRLHYPDFKVRWHKRFDRKNLRRAVEVARTGMGLPSFKNDECAIPSIMNQYGDETSLVEARDYAIVGCITPGIVRNSRHCNERNAAFLSLGKTVETCLFNGTDPEPGFEWVDIKPMLPEGVKDVEECETFEEFYQTYLEYFKWFASWEGKTRTIARDIRKESIKRLIGTLANRKAVTTGHDIYDIDVPLFSFWDSTTSVDAADSMTAIKKLIYDEKKYTMKQLKDALRANWEGYEQMRADFKAAPKFGRDEDEADEVTTRLYSDWSELSGEFAKDARGKPLYPSGLVVTTMFAMAPLIGALPNGRARNEALCDGTLNPHADFDTADSWSRLRSSLKIDQPKYRAWIYNQKVLYPSVEGEAGLDKFTDYVEAAMKAGQEQMQFNMIGERVLRDAQKRPEKYPFLSVRISGYSAYFVTLPEFVQEAVISRVEHQLR